MTEPQADTPLQTEVWEISATRFAARRRLLQFLAASPLLGAVASRELMAAAVPPADQAGAPATDLTDAFVPATAQDAFNVFDLEAAAWKALPPGHFGYIAEGAGNRDTVHANREGFKHIALRPRRMMATHVGRTRRGQWNLWTFVSSGSYPSTSIG